MNRPLSKLASGRKFEEYSEHTAAMYIEVHEDSSTESTYKLPAEVEFRKRSNKDKVYQSYDKIYDWFDEARSREFFEKPWLDLAISYLKSSANILDLGCGMGEPIGKYFIEQGFDLTGIDGSHKLIELAKMRFTQAKFIVYDMREINLNEKFDLIIAWHSLFHLTQDQQRTMFKVFVKHLNPNGILLFTTGSQNGEVWSDNGGEMLYHASLDPKEYKKLLTDLNFELIKYKIEDKECGDASVWMARKL